MARPKTQLRVYLKIGDEYLRFMSLEETSGEYVLLTPRGLTSAQPTEGFRYKSRVFTPKEWAECGVLQPEGEERLPGRPDHISVHEDRSFHIKQRGDEKRPIYFDRLKSVGSERLGRTTRRFLDFTVVGDIARAYTARAEKPKLPCLTIPIKPNQRPIVRCTFSGAQFDLAGCCPWQRRADDPAEKTMVWSITKAMVKVFAATEPKIETPQPPGTLWAFQFVQDDGSLLLKTFRFV